MPHTNAARINRRVLTRWTVTDLGSRRAPEATSHRPPGSPPKPDPRGSSLWNRRPDDHIRYDTASHHLARHDLTRGDLSYRRAQILDWEATLIGGDAINGADLAGQDTLFWFWAPT